MTTAPDDSAFSVRRFDPKDVEAKDAFVFTRREAWVFALALAAFAVARLWRLTAWSLCYDEAVSLMAARLDWGGLLAFAADDIVHPPLFYALLKAWIAVGGESLVWLRLLPPLLAIASVVPFYLLCRELRLRVAEMNIALVLMAFNAYLVYYAEEVRMYSLLMLLALASSWLFMRFFNSRDGEMRALLALFAANLLLVYTHYYGWLLIASEALFLLLWSRRKLKWFLLSVAVLALCFSPWAYAVARVALSKQGLGANIGWIKRPGLVGLGLYYVVLHGGFNVRNAHGDFRWLSVFGTLIFTYPVVELVRHSISNRATVGRERALLHSWLLMFFALPVALAFAASYVLPHSVWHPRYLVISAAPFMLLVAVAVHRLRPSRAGTSVLLWLVVGWTLMVGTIELVTDKKPWCGHDRLTRQEVDSGQYMPDVLKAR